MSANSWDGVSAANPFSNLLSVIARAAGRVARARRHRRQVEELMQLDDRMLRDVGITRLDVMHALSGPLSSDPSGELARQRGDVRRSR